MEWLFKADGPPAPAAAKTAALPAEPIPATTASSAAQAVVSATPVPSASVEWPPPLLQPVASSEADQHPANFTSQETAELSSAEYDPGAPSPLQMRALASMRRCRDAAVAGDSSLVPSPEMGGDVRLWRFLVANSFDCAKAGDAYVAALRWRRDAGIDALRAKIIEANPGFFGGGSSHLQSVFLNSARDEKAMNAHPRTFLRPSGSADSYQLLLDRLGNIVYIETPGLVDPAGVVSLGAEDYTGFVQQNQELLQLVLDELSRRQGQADPHVSYPRHGRLPHFQDDAIQGGLADLTKLYM